MRIIHSARLEDDEHNWSNENFPLRTSRGRFLAIQWDAPPRYQEQEVAEGERNYAEAERIRLQPNNEYELHMSDIELAELRQRRLDYVEESEVEGSHSSAEDTTLLWCRTSMSQAEADLESHDARDATAAARCDHVMRLPEYARQ